MPAAHTSRAALRSLVLAAVCLHAATTPARADPIGWPQPEGLGTPVVISYSFSNLFDGPFAGIPEIDLRMATAEALVLWSAYAPLHFFERPDSGPAPSDAEYAAEGHPDIRIGSHAIDHDAMLAHAFFPDSTTTSGLAGDIHFNRDSGLPWGIEDGFPAIDFLEVLAHEIGHALGLSHILDADAVMNPQHGFRFFRGQPAFLLPADVAAIQALYGAGEGSVQPIPEAATLFLVSTGLMTMFVRRVRARSLR